MVCRRSPRLHPQIHTGEAGVGMVCRRSPRLHPQIHTSEDGPGMACRRSPRLHPLIHATEDGTGITHRRRRRGPSPAEPASLPDNEDMLWEILLRLPPQPSSLPRASAVCKLWRGLVTDPQFIRRFHDHHRKPPLLGVFQPFKVSRQGRGRRMTFKRSIKLRSILKPPDRIPLHAIETISHSSIQLIGCRHGRVLLMGETRRKVTVCDPITGEAHYVHTPPNFRRYLDLNVAVLCAATDQGHVHGCCHSSPYKLVLMSLCGEDDQPDACVYSSETGVWGNRITTTARCGIAAANPGILVGNVLYWSSMAASDGKPFLDLDVLTDDIIEFDLDRQSLAVIKGPPDLNGSLVHQIIQTEEGAVGLAFFSQGCFKMWERKVSRHGAATWLLQKTVEMHNVLGLSPGLDRPVGIVGYDEENGMIFLYVDTNVYMVQLMSMQSRKLYKSCYANTCYPFTSFYAPAGGCDGAEVLHPV